MVGDLSETEFQNLTNDYRNDLILSLVDTPFKLGYRMPAEWERHEATWLSWPKDPTTFPTHIIDKVESIYVEMVEALASGERVNILVDNEDSEKKVSSIINSTKNVVFQKINSVDVWVRDYGPIFVKNSRVAATKWIFNAWGNKYDDLKSDNQTGLEIAASTRLPIFKPGIVLEGGSIDANGVGTILTTRQCLLNRNRNPRLSQNEISSYLMEYLGATNIIWLQSGIAGDDTDGHVDDIARFVNVNTIAYMLEDDASDEDYTPLKKNYEILKLAKDQDGRKLDLVPIPMPKKKVRSKEGRLPASYANFYIGNSVVLVPTYSDKNDDRALEIIKSLFPGRKVVSIECSPLVFGFGSIHCVTQQQPD
jgi:agmatine deiminase